MSRASGAVMFVVTIKPLDGEREAVGAALGRSIPKVHREPGCELYALHECGDQFVLIERWASEDAATTHGAGEAVRAYLAEVAGRVAPSELLRVAPLAIGDSAKGVVR